MGGSVSVGFKAECSYRSRNRKPRQEHANQRGRCRLRRVPARWRVRWDAGRLAAWPPCPALAGSSGLVVVVDRRTRVNWRATQLRVCCIALAWRRGDGRAAQVLDGHMDVIAGSRRPRDKTDHGIVIDSRL